jgi:hypothetical protein
MPITRAKPFAEAGRSLARRKLMPTTLSSAELRQIDAEILRGSIVSARNVYGSVLGKTREVVGSIVNPAPERRVIDGVESTVTVGFNPATARAAIQQELRRVGYRAAGDKIGTIEDLASFQRLDLVVNTMTQTTQEFGHFAQGQSAAVLDEFPAQELIRVESRDQERDWGQRWLLAARPAQDAGAIRVFGETGRMVARKDSRVWDLLGSRELFEDALGNPWPPFAFNSGMSVRDIDRAEAMQLGLVARDTVITPRAELLKLAA